MPCMVPLMVLSAHSEGCCCVLGRMAGIILGTPFANFLMNGPSLSASPHIVTLPHYPSTILPPATQLACRAFGRQTALVLAISSPEAARPSLELQPWWRGSWALRAC